jgi:hypothetical protein
MMTNMDQIVNKIISTEAIADSVFEKQGQIYTFVNPVSYLDAKSIKSCLHKWTVFLQMGLW